MLPNLSPNIYTLSAVAIGYLLIDDTNSVQQNALGNWLMLVAQMLCTNAYFVQLKNQNEIPTDKDTVEMLEKMIKALQKELDEVKKSI